MSDVTTVLEADKLLRDLVTFALSGEAGDAAQEGMELALISHLLHQIVVTTLVHGQSARQTAPTPRLDGIDEQHRLRHVTNLEGAGVQLDARAAAG